MRYELSEHEWHKIKPMLPNKPRGVPRVDDRRILNGIFWILKSGAPWRDLPYGYGPHTTCYNRFVRWRRAGVWDQIMDALTTTHNAAVQIIDTSIVRVHQQGACVADNRGQHMGRSRGGLTSKIHAIVHADGLPVQLAITTGEAHDNRLCSVLLKGMQPGAMLLADRAYDADWIRTLLRQQGAWANIPPKRNRREAICFSPYLYRARNLVERFFNKIKQCRRIATRYDKLAAVRDPQAVPADAVASELQPHSSGGSDQSRWARWRLASAGYSRIASVRPLSRLRLHALRRCARQRRAGRPAKRGTMSVIGTYRTCQDVCH